MLFWWASTGLHTCTFINGTFAKKNYFMKLFPSATTVVLEHDLILIFCSKQNSTVLAYLL